MRMCGRYTHGILEETLDGKVLASRYGAGSTENLQPLESFVAAHVESRWRASLLANMGIV